MNRLLLTIVAFCVACGPEPKWTAAKSDPDDLAPMTTVRYVEPGEETDFIAQCEGAEPGWPNPRGPWPDPLVVPYRLPNEVTGAYIAGTLRTLCIWSDGKVYAEIEKASHGPATTSGPCSPANTGDGNTITMDCGEEKEQ